MFVNVNSAQGHCDLKKLQWVIIHSEPLLNYEEIVLFFFIVSCDMTTYHNVIQNILQQNQSPRSLPT